MGPYKPLRTWVDEFIPYNMEIMENGGYIGDYYIIRDYYRVI